MIKTVQSLWIGGELSKLEQLCIRSFLANDHEFKLYVYEDVGNVPAGTFLADANEIVGAERIFREKSGGSLGAFSDLFRFELLGHKGGVWVDMDLVCLRPLDFSYEYLFGWEDSDRINTAILGAPGNSELVTTLRQVCTSPFIDQPWHSAKQKRRNFWRRLRQKSVKDVAFGTVGPVALTHAVRHLGLAAQARPFFWFYPIHCLSWRSLFDETFSDAQVRDNFFSGSYCVHLWNEYLRRNQIDKNSSFATGSFVESMKRRYGVA